MENEPKEEDQRYYINRRSRRTNLSGRKGRTRTGSPKWFGEMKYEGKVRSMLRKVETDKLEPALGSVAAALSEAGYKNIWDLSQETNVAELIAKTGYPGGQLQKLKEYLTRNGVKVKW